jgi:enoyl-CoA hydratase
MATAHDTGTPMLRCEIDDGIAVVTFDNPAKHNALSGEMRRALPGLLGWLATTPEARVVVLAGAGDRAFMSGADISEFGDQRTSADARAAYDATVTEANQAWATLDKPVIAMIRGYCLGAGVNTAVQADLRIAADDARFAVPAARLGLGYHYEHVEALVALVGPAHAADLLFSARQVTAAEAERMGLVNRVVPADRLAEETMELARAIRANAPLTVAASKAGIRHARGGGSSRDLDRIHAMVEACFTSDDYLEGQAAFAAKRPPEFRGN